MNKIYLCEKDTCTQCMACINICPKGCIKMVDAGLGFTIPKINESLCIKCGACMNSCHQIKKSLERYTPIKTLACWTNIDNDRIRSSSGGVFSVLARMVLKKKGIVYGATMDNKLQVYHTSIENEKNIYKLQGSKYVQSYLGDTFIQVRNKLNEGRLVLFTGTPCQVAGLLTFLRKKYDNLITCDMICHGVPSQKAFDSFCKRLQLQGKCDRISFRFTNGWGFQLAKEFILSDSNSINIKRKPIAPQKAWFMRAFNKNLMFNEACYSCQYTTPERISDFTMADYWGIGADIPFPYSVSKGVSMLLVNTLNAHKLLKELPNFFYIERDIKEAIRGNYNLSHCSIKPQNREQFILDLYNMDVKDIVRRYKLQAKLRDYLRYIKQLIKTKVLN